MLFSSKKTIRIFKTLLVSTYAEIILLVTRIIALSIIVFGGSLINIDNQFKDLLASNQRQQRIQEQFFNYIYSLDHSNSSKIDNYIVGWKEEIWDLFGVNTQFERVIGGIRLIQYRINKGDDCLTTFNYPQNQSELIYSYSPQCDPNDSDSLDNLQPDFFEINNESLCIMHNCSERNKSDIYQTGIKGFAYQNPANLVRTPPFGEYPQNGFIAEITFENKSQYMKKLDNLLQNGWFEDQKTYALAIQINTYNIPSEIINSLTFVIQLMDNRGPIPYLNIQTLNTRPAYQQNWTTFCTLMILADILFMLKIVFEGSIVPKSTQVPQFINIVFEMIFSALCLIEQSSLLKIFEGSIKNVIPGCVMGVSFDTLTQDPQRYFSSISPCNKFIILDALIDLSKMRILFEAVTICFLPFNLFWLLTYTGMMKNLIKFSNMIYRTITSLVKLLILYFILVFCWSAGFFKVFRHNYLGFDQYQKAIYSFLIWTIPSTNDPAWQLQASNTNIYANSLQVCLLMICRMLLFLGLLTFSISSIQTAYDFQFDFRTKRQNIKFDVLSEVSKKLERFSKTYLQDNSAGQHEQNKLIAWLNKDLFSSEDVQAFNDELSKNDIKLQCFGNIMDLTQFLQFLFQIKPQLLFKSSIHFRIVVDIEDAVGQQTDYSKKVHKQQEYQNLGRLLLMLKEKGSRVPILLNFSPAYRPSDSHLITFFKLYPFLYLNQQNYQDLKNFIFTQNFKQWLKSTQVREEQIPDYEELEPSMVDIEQEI